METVAGAVPAFLTLLFVVVVVVVVDLIVVFLSRNKILRLSDHTDLRQVLCI